MKIIDAHSHIGAFGSWARFDFDLPRLKEQMAAFDIEKTFLFGIDSPFHEPSVEIEKTRATFLPPEALRRIYHDNAAALLG